MANCYLIDHLKDCKGHCYATEEAKHFNCDSLAKQMNPQPIELIGFSYFLYF